MLSRRYLVVCLVAGGFASVLGFLLYIFFVIPPGISPVGPPRSSGWPFLVASYTEDTGWTPDNNWALVGDFLFWWGVFTTAIFLLGRLRTADRGIALVSTGTLTAVVFAAFQNFFISLAPLDSWGSLILGGLVLSSIGCYYIGKAFGVSGILVALLSTLLMSIPSLRLPYSGPGSPVLVLALVYLLPQLLLLLLGTRSKR